MTEVFDDTSSRWDCHFPGHPSHGEVLTICRCYSKGSTFFSVILVQPRIKLQPPAQKIDAQPDELTGQQ
jgi:hypothetical protein